jgi:hypothetical protein
MIDILASIGQFPRKNQIAEVKILEGAYMYPRKHHDCLEDWDLFVLRHQKTSNLIIHLFSTFLFWFSPLLALLVSPWWLVGFFISGLVGGVSHLITNEGTAETKEVTSSLQVVHFSTTMSWLFITGKYRKEIEITKNKFRLYQAGKIRSIANPEHFKNVKLDA